MCNLELVYLDMQKTRWCQSKLVIRTVEPEGRNKNQNQKLVRMFTSYRQNKTLCVNNDKVDQIILNKTGSTHKLTTENKKSNIIISGTI